MVEIKTEVIALVHGKCLMRKSQYGIYVFIKQRAFFSLVDPTPQSVFGKSLKNSHSFMLMETMTSITNQENLLINHFYLEDLKEI
jgi:hypothetical protein